MGAGRDYPLSPFRSTRHNLCVSIFKLFTFILFYFFTRIAFSADCMPMQTLDATHEMCWMKEHKAWFSKKCLTDCEAIKSIESKKKTVTLDSPAGGQNPSNLSCHALNLPIHILRDKASNERSFCQFGDGSFAEASFIARRFK